MKTSYVYKGVVGISVQCYVPVVHPFSCEIMDVVTFILLIVLQIWV